MPKSKVRKKTAYVSPADNAALQATKASRAPKPSPAWWGPVMAGMLVVGLIYIVTYYVASDHIGFMNSLGSWNFAIGFGFLLVGLGMAVRWR